MALPNFRPSRLERAPTANEKAARRKLSLLPPAGNPGKACKGVGRGRTVAPVAPWRSTERGQRSRRSWESRDEKGRTAANRTDLAVSKPPMHPGTRESCDTVREIGAGNSQTATEMLAQGPQDCCSRIAFSKG